MSLSRVSAGVSGVPRAAVAKPIWARAELDILAGALKIQKPSDWYRISSKNVQKAGGSNLMKHFRNSVRNAVMAGYPEHEWLPWRFGKLPNGYWKAMENQRLFFDWAAKQLAIQKNEDWYNVTAAVIIRLGGGPLLRRQYVGSISGALNSVYPNHLWLPWRFKRAAKGFWSSLDNQRLFIEYLTKEIKGWKSREDWYQITKEDIVAAGGSYMLRRYYNDICTDVVKTLYPSHEWQSWKFRRSQNQ